VLVRYADDFVVLCRSVWQVKEAGRRIGIILERLKLKLHPEKTRTVNLSHGTEGFDSSDATCASACRGAS